MWINLQNICVADRLSSPLAPTRIVDGADSAGSRRRKAIQCGEGHEAMPSPGPIIVPPRLELPSMAAKPSADSAKLASSAMSGIIKLLCSSEPRKATKAGEAYRPVAACPKRVPRLMAALKESKQFAKKSGWRKYQCLPVVT
ncbi:MAG: hypothetical protein ABIT83_21575 [Massilia sp.]